MCKADLPDDHYHRRPDGKPNSWCRPCQLAYDRERHRAARRRDPEKVRAYMAAYHQHRKERRHKDRDDRLAEKRHRQEWVVARLATLIEEGGWMCKDLARELGVGAGTLWRWRHGVVCPKPGIIEKLRRVQ